MSKKSKAFTLIELLVVIAIIGILVTIAVIALNSARSKARDAKRVANIKQVQTALELFFNDKNRYPTLSEYNSGALYSTSSFIGTTTYMEIVPEAPTPPDGNCTNNQNQFSYTPTNNGGSYTISYCLGGPVGGFSEGPKCATPSGVKNVSCDGSGEEQQCDSNTEFCNFTTCGTSGTYNGEAYPTIDINGQCWMAKNLNIGTMISGQNQTDNLIIEKYCYDDDNANCSSYGGLYQWNEAMGYTQLESSQGLCPIGWHFPSDTEWDTLISFSSNPIGFDALMGGYRLTDGSFLSQSQNAFFWSSSIDGPEAWWHLLDSSGAFIDNSSDNQNYGFSVRCLKN